MTNTYLIRLELTQEEGKALDDLASRECRLTWEQARYLVRSQLISLGALPGAPTIYNPVPDTTGEVEGQRP